MSRRMSLGMIKDFDAPEAPDSPTASTTSGSLMTARVSQSATKKQKRNAEGSGITPWKIRGERVCGFVCLCCLLSVVLRFLLVIVFKLSAMAFITM